MVGGRGLFWMSAVSKRGNFYNHELLVKSDKAASPSLSTL